MTLELQVLDGRLASVQDLGRTRAREGLSTGGALDQFAARAANALVGNDLGAPLAELLLAGISVSFSHDALVAVTGAEARVTVGGSPADRWQPLVVPARSVLTVGPVTCGTLAYLAVGGDWATARFAGGAGPDAGLGFRPDLVAGSRIRIDRAPASLVNPWLGVPLLRIAAPDAGAPAGTALDVLPGPDLDRVEGMREALTGSLFTVDPRSNHVGVRLTGDLPATRPAGEILSHGVPTGAVELPPADELIVLQRGRSLTAGYPVVAVVSRVAQDRVAQLRPGASCRLRWRSEQDCVADARLQRAALEATSHSVRAALRGIAHPEPVAC